MNLTNKSSKVAYIDTGSWSAKAIKEAKKFCRVDVVASSADDNYTYIPKTYDAVDAEHAYCHITTNNTIFGTQYHSIPDLSVPLVADCSSDFLSKSLPIEKFDLIYAGAQKNLGPAGVTLVIVKKEAVERIDRDIPTMLDYRTHVTKKSAFNTPPVFPIYVSLLTLKWLKANGGVDAMHEKNQAKAAKLYAEIDRNPLFTGVAREEDRSLMNVPFVSTNPGHAGDFLELCSQEGISGVKGHRSVGGFRASIYNAMEMEGIDKLVEVMQAFEHAKG